MIERLRPWWYIDIMPSKPLPSDKIRRLPTDIGIEQFRGASQRREAERLEAKWRAWVQSPSRVRRLIGRIAVARRLG
jgi:hypothetical protein